MMPGLSGKLWPVHPHRFPDELLSSWLLRLAHANGLKLQTFTTLGFGRDAALWNRDIDRCASGTLIGELAAQTGAPVEEIKGGMLSVYEGILFHHANPNGNTPWILPLGIYHRKRRDFGMQFCPLCLFEDDVPYFRRHWRLALATLCPRHGTMLHDRCPHCGAPVAWFRNDLGHRRDFKLDTQPLCAECGFDLRRAPALGPPAVDGQSLMALQSIATFHDLGWWFCGARTVQYGPLFYSVLRHLVTWLSSQRGHTMAEAIHSVTGWGNAPSPHVIFEFRPLRERHSLLATATWLLQDWPRRFVTMANAAHLSQSHILLGQTHPFWFESEIRESLSAGAYLLTDEEATQATGWLKRQGRSISINSVSKLIGSRDAKAVRRYAAPRCEPASAKAFWEAMEGLYTTICGARPGSLRRAIASRDRTMLLVARLCKRRPSQVRSMTIAAGLHLVRNAFLAGNGQRQVASALLTYLRDERPLFGRAQGSGVLFPSAATGNPMCPQEWRNRWRAALANSAGRSPRS